MPQFKVTNEEWKTAHQYLDNAPDGTKLPFSIVLNHKNEIVSRKRFETDHRPYQTFHSFIKKDGKIIAFQRGHLGEGTINKAKYAINEKGELYVVKMGDYKRELEENEIIILSNLQLSKGVLKRLDKKKQYVFIQALGVSLNHLFEINAQPKNLEDRLDMAIQLLWKLYRLHEGHDSVTRTPYAHLDIKPDNITMTNNGQLHFIDFGMAEKYPKHQGQPKTAAYTYVAYCDASKKQILTKEQYDVIAAKRVIHLPDSMYGGGGRFISNIHKETKNYVSLLTQQELDQLQLNEYISTFAREDEKPDYTQDKTSAVMLCAMLIKAKYNLKVDNQKLSYDPILMNAITGFYINGQMEHFSALSSDVIAMKLMAALNTLDIHKQYDAYREDAMLIKALERASTFEEVRALVGLKMRGLEAHYEAVLQANELSKAILMLIRDELPFDEKDLLAVINDQSKNIAKAILFLKRHFLDDNFKDIINDPALAVALVNMTSQECEVSVIRMLKSKGFTADEIIKVSQDPRLAKASELARSNRFVNKSNYIDIVKSMTANSSTLDTCLNMDKIESLNELEKAKILMDSNKSQAFNFLFASNIKDTEILKNVIYSEDAIQAFISLQQHKMEQLCVRALEDFIFSREVSKILNQSFADEINLEMLSNDKIRKCIDYLHGSKDKFKGLKILVEMKLIDQLSLDALRSFDFECVCFLKDKELSSFLKWLIECPNTENHLKGFIKEKESNPMYHLYSVLQLLPSEKRFEFIKEVDKVLDIKSFKNDKQYRQEIKLLLSDNDKQAFSKMIYSDKELVDKQTLKNIKSTIKTTTWSYGYFDCQTYFAFGKTHVTVPSSVKPQVDVLSSVSSDKKTFSDGISEIKKIGREQLKVRENMLTFFGKSETQKYFELFETDESFETAFVKKK